jgi:hypothetical protein
MDGETLVDILRRLPSTAGLRTLLLKSRQPQPLSISDAECAPLNSSNLLAQVALALALCQESPTSGWEPERSGIQIL